MTAHLNQTAMPHLKVKLVWRRVARISCAVSIAIGLIWIRVAQTIVDAIVDPVAV